ncbi:MAG: hypothetical protein NC433_14620 [Clostridiales bacterium]|nr:hypothetical protein [Clostridiales bacterium]
MNSNISVLLSALATVFLLSIFWYIFYVGYLKKIKSKYTNTASNSSNNKVLSIIKSEVLHDNLKVECFTELPNTDDDISEALNYIQPPKDAYSLLEKMYEQAGI